MDESDEVATWAEAIDQWASVVGRDELDQAWLLHDRDVWVKNPYYRGAPVGHPWDEPS